MAWLANVAALPSALPVADFEAGDIRAVTGPAPEPAAPMVMPPVFGPPVDLDDPRALLAAGLTPDQAVRLVVSRQANLAEREEGDLEGALRGGLQFGAQLASLAATAAAVYSGAGALGSFLSPAITEPVMANYFDFEDFGMGDVFSGGFGDVLSGAQQVASTVSTISGLFADTPGQATGPVIRDSGPQQTLPAVTQTAGVMPMVAAGGLWLGSVLARTFGRGAAAAVFTAANGVKVRLNQLWPLVRKYGPQAVAAGLGVGAAELGTLLAQAPTAGGPKRRGRGISARDVKTTRRTIKTLRRLVRMAGIGRSSRPRYYYGGGGRHRHYTR